MGVIKLKVLWDALCDSWYEVKYIIHLFEKMEGYKPLVELFWVDYYTKIVAMFLAHWSTWVRVRVWTFCLELRKLDVVYWTILTTWNWTMEKRGPDRIWLHTTLEGPWPHDMIFEVCWDGLRTLSFGLSQSHGHSSWLVCEVALSGGCGSASPIQAHERGGGFASCFRLNFRLQVVTFLTHSNKWLVTK